ncbi:hypothetical protein PFF88_35680, partial [Burkholderia cenocepacia]
LVELRPVDKDPTLEAVEVDSEATLLLVELRPVDKDPTLDAVEVDSESTLLLVELKPVDKELRLAAVWVAKNVSWPKLTASVRLVPAARFVILFDFASIVPASEIFPVNWMLCPNSERAPSANPITPTVGVVLEPPVEFAPFTNPNATLPLVLQLAAGPDPK